MKRRVELLDDYGEHLTTVAALHARRGSSQVARFGTLRESAFSQGTDRKHGRR